MERIEPPKNQTQKRANLLGLRAKTPVALRALALLALAVTLLAIGIAFYRGRGKEEFRMKGMPTELSKDVVAVVNGYERREMDGDVLKYYIKADKATTFTDNHQELENVYLEVYEEKGERFDKISATKAIYIPAENKNFNAFFSGSVNIETRDGLKVKTEQLSYDRETEIAESEELVEFARENLSGKSFGAILKVREKHLELLKDVELSAFADKTAEHDELSGANIQYAKINAGHAVFDQNTEQAEFDQSVLINLTPRPNSSENFSQPTEIRAEKAVAFFENREVKKFELTQNVEIFAKPTDANPKYTKARASHAVAFFDKELNRVELNENVEIETANNNSKPTKIRAGNAMYEKPLDKFDLKNNVEIITVEDERPTVIHSSEATYLQSEGKIFLNGGADITQGNDFVKGDSITAELFANKKLQNAFARGNAYLKQTASDRTTEVSANELNVFFGENQQLQKANANGSANVSIVPAQAENYSKVTILAPVSIALSFRANNGQSILSQMQTSGRTTIEMNAAPGNPNSSFRKLTADTVNTVLNENGKDLAKAEAVGNAELYVEPTRTAPENYKTTVTAPRFDCDFYEGNNARVCSASGKGKAVLVPTVATENRGTRTISAEKLTANFNRGTQDIERFDANGNAKFSELDRNGTANQIVFTKADEFVRMRGEPVVWNSSERAKASEIDWDTKNQKSFLRGKVSTTFYSQKQTKGATPFGKSNAPVFITANEAQFDHKMEVGVYLGNARAWQENNYVRAEKLVLQQKAKRMDGDGRVQSVLYNARRRDGDKEINQPVFAASDRIAYSDENRQLHYEGSVDIRQGKDRIVGGIADVFMNENNEVRQTLMQNNVVITQPNRRVTGTWAQYTTTDEIVILRGNPATVVDAENGTTEGSQMTVSMRDNRVVNQGTTKRSGAGRTRTVYKIKQQ